MEENSTCVRAKRSDARQGEVSDTYSEETIDRNLESDLGMHLFLATVLYHVVKQIDVSSFVPQLVSHMYHRPDLQYLRPVRPL